jgi:hypothetical protein
VVNGSGVLDSELTRHGGNAAAGSNWLSM